MKIDAGFDYPYTNLKLIMNILYCLSISIIPSGSFKEASAAEAIAIADVEETAFAKMLEYIYIDEVTLDAPSALGVLYCSKKYHLPGLAAECVCFLEASVSVDTVADLLSQALVFDEQPLAAHCLAFIREHAEAVLGKSETPSMLSEEALEMIVADELMGVEEVCKAWRGRQG